MIKKNMLLLGASILIAVTIYYLYFPCNKKLAGDPMTDFHTKLINGQEFKLSQLKGSYIILQFWGSWCGPCRRENKELSMLYQELGQSTFDSGKKIEIVSIALEKTPKNHPAAIVLDQMNWKYHIIEPVSLIVQSELARQYNVTSIPSLYLINPDGLIISVNQNAKQLTKMMRKIQD